MRRLRICYLGWGDHVHLERWAGYFANGAADVHVISFSGTGSYPSGVVQHRLGLKDRGDRWKRLKLRWLLSRIRPDIVHVHYAGFARYLDGVWDGPTVVTLWGSDIYRLSELPPSQATRVLSAIASADCVTCDSADLKRSVEQLCPGLEGRVHEIQWGVDTGHFIRRAADGEFSRELGINRRPVVLSPRNFTPLYNLEQIVEAFAAVCEALPNAILVLKNYRGDEQYKARVLGRARALGLDDHIRVVESIEYDRMPELYSLATVSVSVPSSDATPMSLLEAMACGVVPVCSDLPSIREWIDDGRNGYLVQAGDAVTLAERIARLLTDRVTTDAMAARNRRIVEERASQRVHMAAMMKLYEGLAARGGH